MDFADRDVSAWLDGVRAGLGKHTDVFVKYGASTLADLWELDVDDIDQLTFGVTYCVDMHIYTSLAGFASVCTCLQSVCTSVCSPVISYDKGGICNTNVCCCLCCVLCMIWAHL